MPRTTTISRQVTEEIHSYDHQLGKAVRVLVSPGTIVNTVFAFNLPQNFEEIIVTGTDYTDLMSNQPAWDTTKKAGEFQTVHLWRFVDLARARKP